MRILLILLSCYAYSDMYIHTSSYIDGKSDTILTDSTIVIDNTEALDDTVLYISISAIIFCVLSLLLIYRKLTPEKLGKWSPEDADNLFSNVSNQPSQALNWGEGEKPPIFGVLFESKRDKGERVNCKRSACHGTIVRYEVDCDC